MSSSAAVLSFLRSMVIAVTNTVIYSFQHQQTEKMIDACFERLQEAFGSRRELPLILINDRLLAFGQAVSETPYVSRLVQILETTGVESIQISSKATRQEIATLVGILARTTRNANLHAMPNIKLGTIELAAKTDGDVDVPRDRGPMTVDDLPGFEHSKMTEVFETVVRKKKLIMSGIREMVTSLIDVFARDAGAIMALAPLKAVQEYAFVHSTNVCILNVLQARALGIERELLHDIGVAAMLHDIGKMFIPLEILEKPGKPSEEEWRLIREHPLKGARYLADAPDVPELAVIVAYEHHMKYNLSGYPRVSSTWKQHLCSQMTTLSDTFDAMRTHRSYRRAMDWNDIYSVLRKAAGTDLHPMLVNNFLLLIDSVRRQKVAV